MQTFSNAAHRLRHQLRTLGRWLLPGQCLLCGLASGRALDLCPVCESDLPALLAPCPRCALPTGPGLRCRACLQQRPRWQRTQAACLYLDPADALVQRLKFQRQQAAARVMATLMLQRCSAEAWRDLQRPCLIAVPLHPWRQWRRGFNQSALIATHLARATGWNDASGAARRNRATLAQSRLGRSTRERNLTAAFRLDGRVVDGCDCVLVDDVITTGATLNALSEAALTAGARSVSAWAFARTPLPADP